VKRKVPGIYPYVYQIVDDRDEVIEGTFYEAELQRVTGKDVYLIERVLATRGKRVLVRWLGYPSSFDSWIPKSRLQTDVTTR
jgi:hypothetical protein